MQVVVNDNKIDSTSKIETNTTFNVSMGDVIKVCSNNINKYISDETVSEFPPFSWPHSDGTNTHDGYELSSSVDHGTIYRMYQANYNVFNNFGGAYVNGTGLYNGTSQLSANSDSNGNNIPLGEWHKIYLSLIHI